MSRFKINPLIAPYFRERLPFLWIGILSLVAVDFLQLFIPRIIKRVIDDLADYSTDASALGVYALAIVCIAILIGIFRYVWRRCLIGMSRRVEEGLRNRLFGHIQILSADFFTATKTGVLMSHATNDIKQIRMAAGMGLVALTDAIVLGSASILFMAYINIRLTLIVLIPMPVIVLGTRFFSKKMHRRYMQVQKSFSAITETAREIFSGIRTVKIHNMENRLSGRLQTVSQDYIRENLKLVRITGTFMPMMVLLSNMSLLLIICFGGRQAIYFEITTGDFVAFISYLGLLTWPMMALGWVTNLIQRGRASLDRIQTVLSVSPGIDGPPNPIEQRNVEGAIRFSGVTFSYLSAQSPALAVISFHIPVGGSIGIVGPPGSGKTTLLNLIPRLYDVTRGNIYIDALDVREFPLDHLRSALSFVPQEPFLFDGSIQDNITLGDEQISRQKIDSAIQGASLHDLISSLPNGKKTIVGEKGVRLSGGQKQRIALARALLRNSPVLILDDPISQVDTRTGKRILQTIQQAARKKTIVITSHRMSAVCGLDRIITLQDGKIVESGSHRQLLSENGYYAKTFRMQNMENPS